MGFHELLVLNLANFYAVFNVRLFQTGRSIGKACCTFLFLATMSSSLPFVVLTILPREVGTCMWVFFFCTFRYICISWALVADILIFLHIIDSFVCLFVWSFSSHWRIFHTYGDVTINDGRLQILTNALHVWPLSNEGSLACHTYWDTGRPFRWSSQRIRDTHTYCPAFVSGALTTCFYGLRLSLLGFKHPTFRLRDDRSNRLRNRCGLHMPS